MSKSGIEAVLAGKGDFVQIDALTKFLREEMTMEMKKFVLLKLAGLYEKVRMFTEAAKMCESASLVSIAFSEKIKHLLRGVELFIRAGDYDHADRLMKEAMVQASSVEKQEIYITVKRFYKDAAEDFEKKMKRAHAAKIYEKLLQMKLNDEERSGIRERLLDLYEKLGRRKEYYALEKGL